LLDPLKPSPLHSVLNNRRNQHFALLLLVEVRNQLKHVPLQRFVHYEESQYYQTKGLTLLLVRHTQVLDSPILPWTLLQRTSPQSSLLRYQDASSSHLQQGLIYLASKFSSCSLLLLISYYLFHLMNSQVIVNQRLKLLSPHRKS